MSVLPVNKVGRIEWCEAHIAPFTTNAVAIGTTTTAVTDLNTKTTAARAALLAQQAAQDNAKSATNTYNLAIDAMTTAAADIVKQVKTKAALTGDSVYSLANIPVPAAPAPKPAPGKPTDMVVTLEETGALNLKWKCPNPVGTSGTLYQVWRQIGDAGELVYLGGSGTKDFVDDTLPAGSINVMYQIQAVRSTAVGPFATFNVKFGVGAGGAMFATVSEGPAPRKIAA